MEDKNVISFSLDRAGKQIVSKGNTGITGSHRTSQLRIDATSPAQMDKNSSEYQELSFNSSSLLYDNIDKLGDTLKSFEAPAETQSSDDEPTPLKGKYIYNDDSLTEEDLIRDLDSHLNFDVTKGSGVKPKKQFEAKHFDTKPIVVDNFCGACGRQHEPGDVFCRTCGRKYEPIEILCSRCGRKYEYGDVFCGTCGNKYEL